MKFFLRNLVSSIIAGILIGIGGTAFIICKVKGADSFGANFAGAFLFSIGLFSIVIYGVNLFTGKICYVLFEDKKYAVNMLTVLLGNLIGTATVGYLIRYTANDNILLVAEKICEGKFNYNYLQSFILAAFCGIMIYLGVNIYKESDHQIAKYFAIVVIVIIFILCGFEHCIANMFYFSIANVWGWKALSYLLVMILGNTVGGVAIPVLRKILEKLQ